MNRSCEAWLEHEIYGCQIGSGSGTRDSVCHAGMAHERTGRVLCGEVLSHQLFSPTNLPATPFVAHGGNIMTTKEVCVIGSHH